MRLLGARLLGARLLLGEAAGGEAAGGEAAGGEAAGGEAAVGARLLEARLLGLPRTNQSQARACRLPLRGLLLRCIFSTSITLLSGTAGLM